ncbi:MAG: hypothetical protein ABL985_02280 [Casimicrobium sp.]
MADESKTMVSDLIYSILRSSAVLLWLMLVASADASGVLRVDKRDSLAVAGIPIGLKQTNLRGDWRKLSSCTSDMKTAIKLTYSCEFVNSAGVTVWIHGEEVESVTLTLSRYSGQFPAHVNRNDSASSVLRKLRLMTDCNRCWQRVDGNDFGGVTIKSGHLFKSRLGRMFGVTIEFDHAGKLVLVKSRGDGL